MKLQPLSDKVIVRRAEMEKKTAGGIIIPGTIDNKPQEGEVLAVGPGKRDINGAIIPMNVKCGDCVLFEKYVGEIVLDGETYVIIPEDKIIGIKITEEEHD